MFFGSRRLDGKGKLTSLRTFIDLEEIFIDLEGYHKHLEYPRIVPWMSACEEKVLLGSSKTENP